MSIDAKIAEIMEESKLLGLVEEELDEDFISEEEYNSLDEDEQALYELSRKTLRSYVKKAEASKNDLRTQYWKSGPEERDGSEKKFDKRKKGVLTAKDKLYNESIDVSADVDALMFGETLSEEFREKAATIFESAVVVRVKEEVTRLEEEFEEKLAEQVDSITEGLVDKIDGYLDYIVEQWIENNEIALESGIKSEIMESFITGMKGLFQEHYIDVPEEKFDVIGEMEATIEALEDKLNEQVERNIGLKQAISEANRKEIVKTISEGLTDTQTEKFLALAEELTYDDASTFQTKVQTIRENYFNGKPSHRVVQSVVTDSPVDLNEDVKPYQNMDPTVAAYLKAINHLNK